MSMIAVVWPACMPGGAMMTAPDSKVAQETDQLAEANAPKRKLAAILSADVKEFSRLMEADEEGTLRTLMTYRATIDARIVRHGGRMVGTAGDSILAEFASPVEAARCAADVQDELAQRNLNLPHDRHLEFRVGINLGDVIIEGTDLFGNGVNIAARLQALADPGGIVISGGIYDQIKTKLPFGYKFLGEQKVKNIVEPVRIYRVERHPAHVHTSRSTAWRRWHRATAAALLTLAVGWTIWQVMPPLASGLRDFVVPRPTLPAPTRASIAVLPFANQSTPAADDYFSDGISEDLITTLGKFSNVSVTSWNAVAAYKGAAATPQQQARDLHVRYVVDGNVRRSGNRIRVTARLSDAERGTLLWSERYDEVIDDIFTVQDKITRRIVSAMAIRVTYIEQEQASAKKTSNLSAYDHYLQGRQIFREFTRPTTLRAQELFEKAIERDPKYAEAYAALAWTHVKAAEMGWALWPHKALDRAHDLAQVALQLNSSTELAHVVLAVLYTYRQQYELALAELERAVEANPNYTGSHAERGWVLLLASRSGEAVTVLEEALRFDPKPVPNTFSTLAMAYYLNRRYGDAIMTLEGAIGRHPDHVPLHIALAAAYAEAGRTDDAKRAAANVRRLHPFFAADQYGDAFRDPADRERIREGLRKAGL
jgi:adenylate cyclase